MAKVKVYLEKGETELDAQSALFKALNYQINGDTHLRESFDDPAMVHASQKMSDIHDRIYQELIREIIDELDGEYSDGNF